MIIEYLLKHITIPYQWSVFTETQLTQLDVLSDMPETLHQDTEVQG